MKDKTEITFELKRICGVNIRLTRTGASKGYEAEPPPRRAERDISNNFNSPQNPVSTAGRRRSLIARRLTANSGRVKRIFTELNNKAVTSINTIKYNKNLTYLFY